MKGNGVVELVLFGINIQRYKIEKNPISAWQTKWLECFDVTFNFETSI